MREPKMCMSCPNYHSGTSKLKTSPIYTWVLRLKVVACKITTETTANFITVLHLQTGLPKEKRCSCDASTSDNLHKWVFLSCFPSTY